MKLSSPPVILQGCSESGKSTGPGERGGAFGVSANAGRFLGQGGGIMISMRSSWKERCAHALPWKGRCAHALLLERAMYPCPPPGKGDVPMPSSWKGRCAHALLLERAMCPCPPPGKGDVQPCSCAARDPWDDCADGALHRRRSRRGPQREGAFGVWPPPPDPQSPAPPRAGRTLQIQRGSRSPSRCHPQK
eukprot:gene5880-biopygen2805